MLRPFGVTTPAKRTRRRGLLVRFFGFCDVPCCRILAGQQQAKK
jgi:hypothetical protein